MPHGERYMWGWLRKRRKGNTESGDSIPQKAAPLADAEIASSLGTIVDEMKRKGYQGPFANVCDGIMSCTFHGEKVSMNPPWIDSNENPFQMRIVDCEQFCSDSFLNAMGDDAQSIGDGFDLDKIDKNRLRESLRDPHTESCLLGYPRDAGEIPDGPQAGPKSMEDLWSIFLFDGYFYFTRTWTQQLRHRATVEFRDGAMFVTEVATNPPSADDAVYADPFANDSHFAVRQVDFLIKTLLYNLPSPAPLPNNAPEEAGAIALYAFTEYGRIGCYPTFDNTTEYRLCLNGVRGRFQTNPDNQPLVNAIVAATKDSNRDRRQRLHDEIRNRTLLFAFGIPEEELQKGAISEDTPVHFMQQDWQGQPCFFAYTDTTYRVEPSHGCLSVDGRGLAEFVRQYNENAAIVINPAGPATCKLEPAELLALANEA
jgi:hypothetical protein